MKITGAGIILGVIMLTASLGRTTFNGHTETWYNLPMDNITARAEQNGIVGDYWERTDGCKMWGKYIILATDWDVYPYGMVIETSRGKGIVLDTGEFSGNHIDLATTWEKGE